MSTETLATPLSTHSTVTPSPVKPTTAAANAASATAAHPATAAPAAAHDCCQTMAVSSPLAVEVKSQANAAAHSCSKAKAGDGLASLVKGIESTDSATRAVAAIAMGKLGDRAAVPPLLGALHDGDADVAREAATSLGTLGDVAAVEPLIAVLGNSDGFFHPVVRAAACASLGHLHDLRALEPLMKAIHDPIAEASAEAIRSLATLGDQRAVTALLDVIHNVHGYFLSTTRRAAVLGLAKLGGEPAECELRFISGNRWEDAAIRQTAVEALTLRGAAQSAH